MNNTGFVEKLKEFGLTGQEAIIYETLLKKGAMTGYEVAKETGISRSNAYGSLSGLVDKGAASACEGTGVKYVPTDVETFTGNTLRQYGEIAKEVIKAAPKKSEKKSGYITITGARHISDKIHEMLDACEYRMYIMAEWELLEKYSEKIGRLTEKGLKVVILSDRCNIPNAFFYETDPVRSQIRFITDSNYVLTGSLTGEESDTCLYSGEENLVQIMKEALKNKIELIERENKK